MTRLRVPLAVVAVTAALVATPVSASADRAGPAGPARVAGACAELGNQGAGWAWIDNQCGFDIEASVDVGDQPDPACIFIPANDSRVIEWDGHHLAEYAYDC